MTNYTSVRHGSHVRVRSESPVLARHPDARGFAHIPSPCPDPWAVPYPVWQAACLPSIAAAGPGLGLLFQRQPLSRHLLAGRLTDNSRLWPVVECRVRLRCPRPQSEIRPL